MPNAKLKCKYKPCGKYVKQDEIIRTGVGNFCTEDCKISWAMEKGTKDREKARKKKNKEKRAFIKERKNALKTKTEWANEAQKAVNAYIRTRDKGKPCISCDKPDNGLHQRHASHYRSVGACSSLRFNTFNIHTSCATCNTELSGNLLEYRIRLKQKIGVDRVEWLECQNEVARYSVEYLKRIRKIFERRTKRSKTLL